MHILNLSNSARLLLTATGLLAALAHAAEPLGGRVSDGLVAQLSPTAQVPPEPGIEAARRSVHSAAVWLASGVDGWFGDKPFNEGGKVSDGELSVIGFKRRDQGFDLKVRFNARFSLPNVEEKTYLFIGRDDPKDLIKGRPASFSQQQRLLAETPGEHTFFAGLGRPVGERLDFRLGFRGGLKPYAQARYRRPWMLSPVDELEFRETLFWSVDDHFGSTTALSYRHAVSPSLAARWLNAVTITQVDRKFEWHSNLGAYQSMGEQRLLSLELLATGKQDSGVAVSDYGVQARWEQPVYKRWLIGEVTIGHFWPRPDVLSPRGRAWGVGAGLTMKF